MHGVTVSGGPARAAVVVAAATLLAVAFPAVSPLYAQVYPLPGSGAGSVGEALTEANLEPRFEADEVTQFETVEFTARLIYGTRTTPELPTVRVAWSNEAFLTAQNEDAFVIVPTSSSRQFLDQGTRRPGGGFQLDWTWDVTPLEAGDQTVVVEINPTVVVEGRTIPDLADLNQPVPVTVAVNPAQRDFNEVVTAAAGMETDVPDEMTVGDEHDVSASMSMAGHAESISADIRLAQGESSADVTITQSSAAAQVAAPPGALAAARTGFLSGSSSAETVQRQWTVIADEPGQVDLVFTAEVAGRAEDRDLEQAVPITASLRAVEPGATAWETVQKPVLYLTPFVALAATVFGLWTAWSKRQTAAAAAAPVGEAGAGPAPPGATQSGPAPSGPAPPGPVRPAPPGPGP